MATVTEPTSRADTVEAVLIQLERDFTAIYGPDMGAWSRGVRGELIEMQRARRTADMEAHPLHPRKSSAGRRRRHARQLPWRLSEIAPGAATILVTPIWVDGSGSSVRHYLARALDTDGQIIKFVAGGSQRIASLLQAVYPGANWDHPLTWNAASNTLTDRISRKVAAS
jgi:hypothetical protein